MKRIVKKIENINNKLSNARIHFGLRRELKADIDRLSPWYQPISFGYGLETVAVTKSGARYTTSSLDRGIQKWKSFIEPNLPFDLAGKRILEVGCNAGLFLNEGVRQGAREAIGIEKDDRYYQQARFVARTFSRLKDSYHPVRIFQGAMEDFDYESAFGKFDLAFLLNVIYHIGKSDDYAHLSEEDVFKLQVSTLRSLSRAAKYLLFQANQLEDEGRGKGRESLMAIINAAGLVIEKETTYDHPRGLIVLARSDALPETESFPIKRMLSKYFLPAHQNAEREVVDLVEEKGQDGFEIAQTRYYRLRTAQDDWLTPGVAHLPEGLDQPPKYWIVPWSVKPKTADDKEIKNRLKAFPETYAKFLALISSMLESGFDEKGAAIPGFRLAHPEYDDVFIYTDGNHRMGVLSHIADTHKSGELDIPIFTQQVIEREKLLNYPLVQQLIEEGFFTPDDVIRWFDNAFNDLVFDG